jgi:hypothetical protein
MSDEEPHDGQESATMHWLLALASGCERSERVRYRAECNRVQPRANGGEG